MIPHPTIPGAVYIPDVNNRTGRHNGSATNDENFAGYLSPSKDHEGNGIFWYGIDDDLIDRYHDVITPHPYLRGACYVPPTSDRDTPENPEVEPPVTVDAEAEKTFPTEDDWPVEPHPGYWDASHDADGNKLYWYGEDDDFINEFFGVLVEHPKWRGACYFPKNTDGGNYKSKPNKELSEHEK
jgi:hypothetical protein